MKKLPLALMLFMLLTSCMEEQVPATYFAGTIWSAYETGGIFGADNKLTGIYINTHVLTLNATSFSHIIYRKEAAVNGIGYADKDTTYMEGVYKIRYPNLTLNYGNVERAGIVEWGTINLEIDDTQRTLQFLKNTAAGAY
ncbi:MAG: hypothetical protein LBD21_01290 [Tannerellaceae bacterium]|jgi:hypothetical protein|nr:hypothetical protein [Tannerellaceae bacterium]